MQEPIKVTVTDPATGEILGEQTIKNNYVLVVHGTCHVSHTTHHHNGTTILTVKGGPQA